MIILEPVQAAVWNCLQNFMYSDAVFLAERLHAELNSEESAHTLAVAYYKNNAFHQAYDVLGRTALTRPLNKYLFARCCCAINRRQEAETCLLGQKSKDNSSKENTAKSFDNIVAEFGDLSCFVFALLGELYRKTERRHLATMAFRKALALNPFLFSAFQSLCDAGDCPNPKDVFKCEAADAMNFSVGTTCWQNFAHTRVTMNQSVAVHPHHQYSQVFPEGHSTPAVPTSTPMQQLNKGWLPPAPCKAKANAGRASPPVNLGNVRKRQLELLTPGATARHPAFGALFLAESSGSALNASTTTSFMDLTSAGTKTRQSSGNPIQQPTVQLSALNIKDLQPPGTNHPQTQGNSHGSVQGHPLRSNPLVVSQTNNLGDQDEVPARHEIQPPPLKRSARLQVPTKENKMAATKLTRAGTRTAAIGSLPTSSGVTAGTKRQRVRGALNALRSARGSSDTENKAGCCSTDQTSNKPEAPPASVDAENSKNLEKSAAEEDRPDLLELASMAQRQSASGLMTLFQQLGLAYSMLTKFECIDGLEALKKVNHEQSRTGWVLCLKARLLFELSLFEDCVKVFELLRQVEPLRLDGLEYYSSALWQLQKEVELSSVAGAMLEITQHHAVPWITLANCFSANQEHHSAIKYFQRALQLDHESSYMYTLLAQEYFLVEDIENAQAAFRNALYVNPLDYRAWMGLGMVSFKQEQYKLAKVMYKKALRQNPKNTVVMCHLGLCLVKMKEIPEAVETFKRALAINPRNPMCKYHLASTYVTLCQFDEARELIEELTEETPREAQVFFLLGKIYKKLGQENKSLMYISWAVDLDPKVGKAPWKDRQLGSSVAAGAGGGGGNNANAENGGNANSNGNQGNENPAPGVVPMDSQPQDPAPSASDSSLMQHSGFEEDEDEEQQQASSSVFESPSPV